MARPTKKGLDYFPLDTYFFEDPKIGAIAGEFGIKGEIVTIKLLCAIYREGYFILWNEMLQLKFLKEVAGVNQNLLDAIIERLVKWGFFDEALYNSAKILTSKGIQERYFNIIKRRNTNEDLPYLLVNVCNNRVNVCNNPQSAGLMYTLSTQRKGKERKEKEEEEEEKKTSSSSIKFSSEKPIPLRECLNLALQEQHWCEIAMMQLKIADLSDLKLKMDTFLGSTILNAQEQEKTLKDFKQHFVNWQRKQTIDKTHEIKRPKIEIV